MAEKLLNYFASGLVSSVGASDTTFFVSDVSGFDPDNAGTWRAQIDSEIVIVDSVDAEANSLHISQRGAENTTALPHSANASVFTIASAGGIAQYVIDSAVQRSEINGAASSIAFDDLTASKTLVSNGSGKVAASAVTTTELGYVSGVTSSIQTQIDAKAASASLATVATTGAYNDLSGKPDLSTKQDIVSGVSNTEIGYLDGVTSAIQTQLNTKANTSSLATVATSGAYNDLSGKPDLSLKQDVVSGVSNTEIGYLDGVTSAIQTQLNTKANSSSLATVATTGSYDDLLDLPEGGDLSDAIILSPDSAGRNYIIPANSSSHALTLASSGGSAELLRIVNESSQTVAGYTATGKAFARNLELSGTSNSDVPFIVRSGTGSSNVAEITSNNGGVIYLQIASDGTLTGVWFTALALTLSTMQTDINTRMVGSNNLSEITSQSTARTSLGLGSMALESTSSYPTTGAVTAEISAACGTVSASIPTNNSSLTNGAGYITSASLPTAVSQLSNDSAYQTSSDVSAAISAAVTGFTGSGSYTSFSITNGLITSAS